MSLYFRYLDFPTIPEDFVSDIYHSINTNENHFIKKNVNYSLYPVSSRLRDHINSFFPKSTAISIQVINGNLPIHRDIGRTEAINYIIETGGEDVQTCFYNDNKILDSHRISAFKWHWLNVSVHHTVINVKKDLPRISITLTP
jgi:hypothetical protein